MYSKNYRALLERLYGRFKSKEYIPKLEKVSEWNQAHPNKKKSKDSPYNSSRLRIQSFPQIIISFPGYKTDYEENKIDFQVSLNDQAISHVNIIVDLYNKVYRYPCLYNILENLILDIGNNALKVNKKSYEILDKKEVIAPTSELTSKVLNLHKEISEEREKNNMKKIYYNSDANNRNYTLDELTCAIPLILLQEDINYPKSEGRKMALKRYLEGIYLARYGEGHFTLKELIDRTQFDKSAIPEDFTISSINYTQVNKLDVDWTNPQ